VGFCQGIAKFILVIALILVVALGVALIAIGAWGLATAGNISGLQAAEPAAFSFYIASIVIGSILLLSSIAGFLAICKGKTGCTNIFSALMLMCTLLLLALAIYATILYTQFQSDPDAFVRSVWQYLPSSAKESFGKQYGCDYLLPVSSAVGASCFNAMKSAVQQWALPGLIASWCAFALLGLVTALLCGLNRREKSAQAAAASAPVPEVKQQVVVQQAPASPVYAAPGQTAYAAPGQTVYTQPPAGTVYAQPPAGTVYAQPPAGTVYAAPGTQVPAGQY
jgi:hypothetical protein